MKSPLRYPGGKYRAIKTIFPIIQKTESKRLVSPFMGGGSIELTCAAAGIEVEAYDAFEPLVNFWNAVLNGNAEKVAQEARKMHPLSRDDFYGLQRKIKNNDPGGSVERAAWFYAVNRSSFSGVTTAGGMSPGHKRFTESSIGYLENFECPNIRVAESDFSESIANHPDDLLYCDPPYVIKSALYGNSGDKHKGFMHELLAEMLNGREQWILSYNDCEWVRDAYDGFTFIEAAWKYGMNSSKKSSEVIIVSPDVAEALDSDTEPAGLLERR